MPNTSVFTGADGSITLSVPQGTERGEGAGGHRRLPDDQRRKGAEREGRGPLRDKGLQRDRPALRDAAAPRQRGREGNHRAGLHQRRDAEAHAGRGGGQPPAASWAQPAFNITLLAQNAAAPDVRNTVTLYDVKLENWVGTWPEDDF